MTPFGFPEEPARDRRYDQLPFPVDSPSAGIDYSDAAGLIVAPDRTTPPEVVRVTSATATSGLYPAQRELWSDPAAPPRLSDRSTAQDCWAQGPNGEALTATRYDALFLGYHTDGLPVYCAAGATAISGGDPDADFVTRGYVSLSTQSLGKGEKRVDGLSLNYNAGANSGSNQDMRLYIPSSAARLLRIEARDAAVCSVQIPNGNLFAATALSTDGTVAAAYWFRQSAGTVTGSTPPTVTVSAGAGAGGASAALIFGGNSAGQIRVSTGTSGVGTGVGLARFTYGAFNADNAAILLTPASSTVVTDAGARLVWPSPHTTGNRGFDLMAGPTAPGTGASYLWNYFICTCP